MSSVLVVGSINMDVVNRVHQHPLPGETVHGLGTEYSPGGKGANQAVAASLSGSDVTILGAVGTDSFGNELRNTLEEYKVQTKHVIEKSSTSGLAFITVDDSGENTIILSSGANGLLSIEDIRGHIDVWDTVNVVLVQNEIPWETTSFVIQEAGTRGIQVFFNPAPASNIPREIVALVDVLILNETEAESITGVRIEDPSFIDHVFKHILQIGVKEVILTLGDKGSQYMNVQGEFYVTPAFPVQAVDTTAAGDTFIGAFVAARGSKRSVQEALTFASAAAALTVTKRGAQVSIPTRQETLSFLERYKMTE